MKGITTRWSERKRAEEQKEIQNSNPTLTWFFRPQPFDPHRANGPSALARTWGSAPSPIPGWAGRPPNFARKARSLWFVLRNRSYDASLPQHPEELMGCAFPCWCVLVRSCLGRNWWQDHQTGCPVMVAWKAGTTLLSSKATNASLLCLLGSRAETGLQVHQVRRETWSDAQWSLATGPLKAERYHCRQGSFIGLLLCIRSCKCHCSIPLVHSSSSLLQILHHFQFLHAHQMWKLTIDGVINWSRGTVLKTIDCRGRTMEVSKWQVSGWHWIENRDKKVKESEADKR